MRSTECQLQSEDLYLNYFNYKHLPESLQKVSKPFGELARTIYNNAPWHPQTTVALQKLLEAKDAAVRAAIK